MHTASEKDALSEADPLLARPYLLVQASYFQHLGSWSLCCSLQRRLTIRRQPFLRFGVLQLHSPQRLFREAVL